MNLSGGFKTLRRLGVILSVATVLAGCTTTPKQLPSAEAGGEQARLYALPYWKAEGRMGIQANGQAWNANLFWEHDRDQDRLRLSGPFNQGVVSIILQDDLILINEGNGVTETTTDVDAALTKRLGFTVPVTSLRYWMLGIPSPQGEFTRNDSGTARQLVQHGWIMDFDRYTPFAGAMVPGKSAIRGKGVKLKVVVDNWSTAKQ
ncbi:MAG: outer membrane lipoprotein LolB [Methylococcaceae bacterium]|nr:outer membrane lipoprotein LolB [Methylococcaceae bacterium]